MKLNMQPLTFLFALLCLLMVSVIATQAFAQAVPEGDAVQSFLSLIANWKVLGPVGIGSGIIVLLVQLLKSPSLGGWFKNAEWKRVIITVLGQAYAVIFMVQSGQSWVNAAVVGLFASGGAVAIWEAIKPLIEKK